MKYVLRRPLSAPVAILKKVTSGRLPFALFLISYYGRK